MIAAVGSYALGARGLYGPYEIGSVSDNARFIRELLPGGHVCHTWLGSLARIDEEDRGATLRFLEL